MKNLILSIMAVLIPLVSSATTTITKADFNDLLAQLRADDPDCTINSNQTGSCPLIYHVTRTCEEYITPIKSVCDGWTGGTGGLGNYSDWMLCNCNNWDCTYHLFGFQGYYRWQQIITTKCDGTQSMVEYQPQGLPMSSPGCQATCINYTCSTHQVETVIGDYQITDTDCCTDSDGDGISACIDCNDNDPSNTDTTFDHDDDRHPGCSDCADHNPIIYPGAPELCDGKDNDCDLQTDEDGVCCIDNDGDGFFGIDSSCLMSNDCNDSDNQIFPGNSEVCDGKDNNCNGVTDEGTGPCCGNPCCGDQCCKNGGGGDGGGPFDGF